MRKHRTEKMLREKVDRNIPDLKDHIKETSTYRSFIKEAQKPRRQSIFKRQRRFAPAYAMGVLLLVVGLFLALPLQTPVNAETTSIQMEFNPSFGIDIDEDDTIVELNAYNDDAESLFEETGDLEGETLDDGLDQLVEASVELGYLSDENSEILYTVSGDNKERAETKARELETKIPEVAQAKGISNARAMRSVNGPPGEDELEEARGHDIGFMKMRLIKNILEADDTYDFETLKEKSVGELKDIIETEDIEEHGPPFEDRDNMPGPPDNPGGNGSPGRPGS
ncbi:MAG: anti-sigma-I factor RsgI family protein [Bacillota bacterium]